MPEVGIGFVPDVGGTYLLSRSPGQLERNVALTAGHVSAADAIELRLADHLVDSADVGALIDQQLDQRAHVARVHEVIGEPEFDRVAGSR